MTLKLVGRQLLSFSGGETPYVCDDSATAAADDDDDDDGDDYDDDDDDWLFILISIGPKFRWPIRPDMTS